MSSAIHPKQSRDPTQRISFFDLPRELRDFVYHQFWRSNPALHNSSGRFNSVQLHLRYEGSYHINLTNKNIDYNNPSEEKQGFPLGLAANKQLLREALQQYVRHAEWFWGGDYAERTQPGSSTLLDVSRIKDVTIHVGSFSSVEDLRKERWWWNNPELGDLVPAMEEDHETGYCIRRLRIAGNTDEDNLEEEYLHAKTLAQRHSRTLRRAKAECVELSLWHDDPDQKRVYEVIGEGEGVRVDLVMDKNI